MVQTGDQWGGVTGGETDEWGGETTTTPATAPAGGKGMCVSSYHTTELLYIKKKNSYECFFYLFQDTCSIPYTRIFSSDKNFEGLNYVGINFRGLRTTC